ncbi:MAG: response regulator, partial [Anaerolineae bacterium]|nr:response regulator [Anaerolineae bacterium]
METGVKRGSQMDKKPRILIVDDDDSTRRTLRMIFGREGYQTTEAATGREALAVAGRQPADLVLLDIRLPDMEGVELLAPLKALDPDMVVMIVTGNA